MMILTDFHNWIPLRAHAPPQMAVIFPIRRPSQLVELWDSWVGVQLPQFISRGDDNMFEKLNHKLQNVN